MTCRLSKSQECFENLYLRFVQANAVDLTEQRLAIMLAKLIVKLALRRLEIAMNRLLEFLGKILRDLRFRAPQYKWPKCAGENLAALQFFTVTDERLKH